MGKWLANLFYFIILDLQLMTYWNPVLQPIVYRRPWALGSTVLTILATAFGAVIG